MDPVEQAILEILTRVAGQEQANAQQATLDTTLQAVNAVLTIVRSVLADLNDPVTGLAAIQAQLATFQATTATDVTAILTAIAAVQQAGSPVTLPATPPSAYIAPTAAANAGAVWSQAIGLYGDLAGLALGKTFHIMEILDSAGGFINSFSPVFTQGGITNFASGVQFNTDTPLPNPANILSTDTLVSWLTRELPTWTVDATSLFPPTIYVYGGGSSLTFYVKWTDADFEANKAVLFPPSGGTVPPVWPGLSGVTLGSPLTLVDGLVVSGPIAGVIVGITAVAYPVSYYPFGTIKSYVRAGAVAFTDDNGDSEFPQPLGPNTQVILPKSMAVASSASFRVTSGVVGTVTPFTIP